MSRTDLHSPNSKASFQGDIGSPSDGRHSGMTVHEASRAKKAVETNVKAIENRISFFKREEEKIWRDLEEVRRQAATIEEGRTRTLEKKLADRAIQQERELVLKQNRDKAVANKTASTETKKRTQFLQMREKQLAGQEQRRASQDILRQKKMHDAQSRLQNSERAVAVQRSQLEARLKANQEKAERLEKMRQDQEADRMAAEHEVTEVESKLPQLEAEELVCLQRLQNSRIVTQSVLEELESSLGTRSSVTALLRQKQRGQDHFNSTSGLHTSGIQEDEENDDEPPASPQSLGHGQSQTELKVTR
uniref:Uncharacterized protein n=1 Tax=Alexandrium catenella TaxID=2925 RepID=A0A7S1S9R8_ALECA|mmetsp:Transcript_89407/g.237576  ORF Transcript_89407/g.237576 Transcript_89407/m.237576 type:complete len:305 (+) Transcript_89407:73-987(+)